MTWLTYVNGKGETLQARPYVGGEDMSRISTNGRDDPSAQAGMVLWSGNETVQTISEDGQVETTEFPIQWYVTQEGFDAVWTVVP